MITNKAMKPNHLGINSLVLGVFVFVGFISGRNLVDVGKSIIGIAPEITASPQDYIDENLDYPVPFGDDMVAESIIKPDQPTSDELKPQAPPQVNTLIIFVDNLKSDQVILQGLWLMMYFSDGTHLTFMPIYPTFPTTGEISVQNNQRISSNFQLNSDTTLSLSSTQFLNQNNYYWDNIIIIDKHALVDVVDFWQNTAGTSSGNVTSSSLLNYPSVEEDPELSLQGQTQIFQVICQSMAAQPVLPDITQLVSKTRDHLVTDLQFEQFTNQWQIKLNQGNRSSCEFPYLNYR